MKFPLRVVTPAWRALGFPGAVGVLALLAAAVVAAWPEARDRLPDVVAARARAAPAAPSAMPQQRPAAQRVADLLELAVRTGIAVSRIEQRPMAGSDESTGATLLTMPARGRYADLRRFIEDALHEVPGLALESMALHRGDVDQVELAADLQWRLEGSTR